MNRYLLGIWYWIGLRLVWIAHELKRVAIDLWPGFHTARPLGARIEMQFEHDACPDEDGVTVQGIQADLHAAAEARFLVGERHMVLLGRSPDIDAGRQRLALHLEDIREVRVELQRELDIDGSIREGLQVQVVVQRTVHPPSECEEQRTSLDLAHRIAQRAILILPLGGAMPVMRTPEQAPGLAAYQDLVGGQHAGIPGEEPVQLFGQDLSIQSAGERHSAAPQDEGGLWDTTATVHRSAPRVQQANHQSPKRMKQ